MSFWYLATPYTKFPGGIDAAFKMAAHAAARCVRYGLPIFSPIAHTHPIAIEGGIDPLDLETWLRVDQPFIEAAAGLIVYQADGWESSKGIAHEIEAFQRAGKPVLYMKDDA